MAGVKARAALAGQTLREYVVGLLQGGDGGVDRDTLGMKQTAQRRELSGDRLRARREAAKSGETPVPQKLLAGDNSGPSPSTEVNVTPNARQVALEDEFPGGRCLHHYGKIICDECMKKFEARWKRGRG